MDDNDDVDIATPVTNFAVSTNHFRTPRSHLPFRHCFLHHLMRLLNINTLILPIPRECDLSVAVVHINNMIDPPDNVNMINDSEFEINVIRNASAVCNTTSCPSSSFPLFPIEYIHKKICEHVSRSLITLDKKSICITQ